MFRPSIEATRPCPRSSYSRPVIRSSPSRHFCGPPLISVRFSRFSISEKRTCETLWPLKRTAVGTVLNKLSGRFESYRDVLKATRKDFFRFSNVVTDEQFAEFVQELEKFEQASTLKIKQDEFLDLYGAWLKSNNHELYKKVIDLAREIHDMDPGFDFERPK